MGEPSASAAAPRAPAPHAAPAAVCGVRPAGYRRQGWRSPWGRARPPGSAGQPGWRPPETSACGQRRGRGRVWVRGAAAKKRAAPACAGAAILAARPHCHPASILLDAHEGDERPMIVAALGVLAALEARGLWGGGRGPGRDGIRAATCDDTRSADAAARLSIVPSLRPWNCFYFVFVLFSASPLGLAAAAPARA